MVKTDHRPLEQIHKKNLKQAPPRLQRMLLRLQPYDCVIKYLPGREMVTADALSRLSPLDEFEVSDMNVKVHHLIRITPAKMEEFKEETAKDETLQLLAHKVMQGWPDSGKKIVPALKPYWPLRDDISVEDGLILLGSRVTVPELLRGNILQQIHGGHFGIEKCKLRAKSCVYWPCIYKEIENLVNSCCVCQKYHNSQQKEPMIPTEIPLRPWQSLSADLFYVQQSWFLIVVDYYSKFPFVKKLHNLTTGANNSSNCVPQGSMTAQYSSANPRESTATGNSANGPSSGNLIIQPSSPNPQCSSVTGEAVLLTGNVLKLQIYKQCSTTTT